MREGMTTIQLSKETRDMLAALGQKRETYDEIVTRLIKFYKATISAGERIGDSRGLTIIPKEETKKSSKR